MTTTERKPRVFLYRASDDTLMGTSQTRRAKLHAALKSIPWIDL